jgi:hypothetical protein
MLDSLFKSGRLLLETSVPPETPAAAEPSAWLVNLLVVAFAVLAIAFLKRFLQVLPYMADSYLRVRGSAALEGSIRVSQDRNLVALVFTIPAVLLVYRYRLYDPSLIRDLDPNLRLAGVALALLAYVLVRHMIYLWVRPRQRVDIFRQAHRVAYTYFIFLMLLVLITVGILEIAGLESAIVRYVLYAEIGLVFILLLHRTSQILSLSCNHLRTFLYLCALEILPAVLLVVSAVVL